MPTIDVSDALQQRITQSHYLVAYLAKLYHEQSGAEDFTVPVTIRKGGASVSLSTWTVTRLRLRRS